MLGVGLSLTSQRRRAAAWDPASLLFDGAPLMFGGDPFTFTP